MSGSNDILIANIKEKGNEVTAFLEKEGIQVRYTSVRLIDYLIAGRIAVVRRTVESFLAELANKMVYRTAPEFKRSFPDPIYIVEGSAPAATISATTPGRAGITYLTFVHRIPIIFSSTPEESAKYIALMMKQAEFAASPTDQSASADANTGDELDQPLPELDAEVQIQVLSSIPGISRDNATLLLSRFGSLKGVCSADEKDLQKIKGIGAKKARAIISTITTVTMPTEKDSKKKAAHSPIGR